MSVMTVAIAGHPNSGKTTLLNALTGASQRVGNWPGVTVELREGSYRAGGRTIRVVDLPGVYGLAVVPGSESVDEGIARDFIESDEAHVIVDVVDASNLERNLYLTSQLLETRCPLVVALNKMDVARARGIELDATLLAERLGCPVVPMVASRGEGLDQLKAAVRDVHAGASLPTAAIDYGPGVERAIAELSPLLVERAAQEDIDGRLLALRVLEGYDPTHGSAGNIHARDVTRIVAAAGAELGEDLDILVADGRFSFAHDLVSAVARRSGRARRSTSDAIDRIVLNRWLGPVIFLGLMYLMFMFTINLGGAFVDFFDGAAGTIFVDGAAALLGAMGSPGWLIVVVANGVGGGVQVVATFVPIIGFLYLFLSLLEDSGYMARAAFLMDRLMRVVGLPGKSVVPLIVGFGCNVPAVMASRTLERERDRIMTVAMTPFMSCGARLTVYALFAAAFFPVGGQNVVFALYIVGVGVAIGTGIPGHGTFCCTHGSASKASSLARER
jgi:ferrous iron transport protein B